MNMSWKEAACLCETVYGTYVDWEERFFICPECDEPIYEDDWEDMDLSFCPVCEFIWEE